MWQQSKRPLLLFGLRQNTKANIAFSTFGLLYTECHKTGLTSSPDQHDYRHPPQEKGDYGPRRQGTVL